MSQKSNFDGGKEQAAIRSKDPVLGNWMRRVATALNRLGSNSGVSPVGEVPAPPTIGAINVKASGETVHVTIADTSPASRTREYWVEHSTSPNFTGATTYTKHLVASRDHWLTLPTLTDSGGAQPWYFRGYSQEPGSPPSAPVYYGGLSPTGVTLTGSTRLTPLPSTGSGTANSISPQGGWGRGKASVRIAGGKP
jgi:hypothetical protein